MMETFSIFPNLANSLSILISFVLALSPKIPKTFEGSGFVLAVERGCQKIKIQIKIKKEEERKGDLTKPSSLNLVGDIEELY
jgi:hypothetical protein